MDDFTLAHWKRYGKERVYANRADGTRLGYLDLETGTVTLEDGADARVADALLAWSADITGGTGPERRPDLEPVAHDAPTSLDTRGMTPETAIDGATADTTESTVADQWVDLAANLPGQGVRAEADAAWQASKDRSKFLAYGARLFNVHTNERAWRVGADGEEAIGSRLNKLRDHGWRVLHSIPVGDRGSDIDHVLIGPGGVFTINSKNHPGGKIWVAKYQMRVNGQVVPYLRNASHEAARAARLLTEASDVDVKVRGCIIVLTGSIVPEVTIKQMPDDVRVLDRMDIPGIFKRAPKVLDPDQVERIFEAARRSTTWVGAPKK